MRLRARPVVRLITLMTLVTLTACEGDPDRADEPTSTTSTSTTSASTTSTSTETEPTPAGGSLYEPGDIDAGLTPWIEDATADLAARLPIEPGAIITVAAVLVTWPDAALGCPEPDRQYAAVATDGALVELLADGAVYRYHAGGDRGPFLCPRPLNTRPAPGA